MKEGSELLFPTQRLLKYFQEVLPILFLFHPQIIPVAAEPRHQHQLHVVLVGVLRGNTQTVEFAEPAPVYETAEIHAVFTVDKCRKIAAVGVQPSGQVRNKFGFR